LHKERAKAVVEVTAVVAVAAIVVDHLRASVSIVDWAMLLTDPTDVRMKV